MPGTPMTCVESERLIHEERDDRLAVADRRALEAHVAECAGCGALRRDLEQAAMAWRWRAENTPAPDADSEWLKIRRAIRSGTDSAQTGGKRSGFRWWQPVVGLAGAAAALAVAVFIQRSPTSGARNGDGVDVASVEFVEFAEGSGSPFVFVDRKTGFVVVWAAGDPAATGS